MSKIRRPRTTAQAVELLERFAALDGDIAAIEAGRTRKIAAVNADADETLLPLTEERAEIAQAVQPWFEANHGEILPRGRKSAELGGCMIGTRNAREQLTHAFADDAAAVLALRETRLGNQTTKVRYSLDRAATLKMLQSGGKSAEALASMGFEVSAARERFYIERVEQGGTIGG